MSLKLYNTLTGKKEVFTPINPQSVGLYTCGPTVYNYAHIGNLRAYVFADVLRRTLEYEGFAVRQVMNITDVGHLTSDGDDGDDKMIKALKREGKPFTFEAMQEIARKYETAFREDLHALNIALPKDMPRASEHISEDIEMVQKLLEKGIAYKTSTGIYFDTAKFPSYGTRGGFKLGELKEGARVAINPEKKNPRDFSLWKFSLRQDSGQATDLGWDFSPYGKGFPGWHIECSAMSRKYLGQPFDIHTGGIDHIPVHHQNEIAQSEAAYGVSLANYWLHNEHLILGDSKMAKSGESFLTLQTLVEKGVAPLAYRYFLLTAHYRSPINFSFEALLASQNSFFKLLYLFGKLEGNGSVNQAYKKRFSESVADDLHTPAGIAVLWDMLKDGAVTDADKRATFLDFDSVLGLDIENQSALLRKEMESVPDDIKMLAQKREEMRKAKNFKEADLIRGQLQAAGFEVMDTDAGPLLCKKV